MLLALDQLVRGPERCGSLGSCLLIEPTCSTLRRNQFPSQALIVTNAARRLIELSKAGDKLQHIVVLGEKDPTLHPDFRAISENLRELRNKWFPRTALCLLSDANALDRPDVRIALSIYDKPILRLEAGTQKTFRSLTGEKKGDFKQHVDLISRLELGRLILQARFVQGAADNSTETELRSWLKHVADVHPAAVQIYTLPRPDVKKKLKPVPLNRLEKIAAQVNEKTGIPCEVF